MVLEQLYSAYWIEQRAKFAFLLGLTYSIIGIGSAAILFSEDPGLAAIAFTSLLILPSLNKMMAIEEDQMVREQKFNIPLLFRDHWDIIKVYIFLFLGIMLAFSLFSLLWDPMITSHIFAQQEEATSGAAVSSATGQAYYSANFFKSILMNNLLVLLFCLIASLIYGAGSIFVITWNASAWGVRFALYAKDSALATGQNPFVYFSLTMLAVFPHLILEAGSYLLAAIAGGIISKAVIKEKPFSEEFNRVLEDGLMMFLISIAVLVLAVTVESYLAGTFISWFLR